ncbi:MAG TPA: dihydrofolate reductase family protein, partial [Nitrolancea sp.]|nr:dihydrofolate reductase family protein [Nitrolancea sp.]
DRHDAIIVGIGTLLKDDPLLTTRLPHEMAGDGGSHHPLRVVLDSLARTPLDSAMLNPHVPGTTLIATTPCAPHEAIAKLRDAGAEVVLFPEIDNRVDLEALLRFLAERGVNRVLVEGGASVLGAFFDDDLIDSVTAFISPVIVGGTAAPSPLGGEGRESMDLAARLSAVELRQVGVDFMISGRLHPLPTLEELLCSVESSRRSATSSRSIAAEAKTS